MLVKLEQGADLEAILDRARAVNLEMKFNELKALKFRSALDLVRHVRYAWDLTDGDVLEILRKVTWAPHAPAVQELVAANSVLEIEPEPTCGCFTGGRKRHPRTSSASPKNRYYFPSPGTGTACTDQSP